MFNLQGKTAIISGASSGLGEQFARSLSRVGARVLLAARNQEKLKVLTSEIGNSKTVPMDVSSKDSVADAFSKLQEEGEKIDICVNNAGIAVPTPIFEKDKENTFESILQTNLLGVWYMAKEAANHMRHHRIEGSIINIGSVNGDAIPATYGTAYSVSKAAVIHLTKTLVGELSPHKIRINCISPGWFRTPMNDSDLSHLIPFIPHGDIADPQDLEALILYLASNKASKYVTGSCFTIDGGMSWGGRPW